MSNSIENLKEKIEKVIQLELLENKLNRINRIRINKIKEIIRKGSKELEIKRINERTRRNRGRDRINKTGSKNNNRKN